MSNFRVFMLIGPTGVGKTRRSVALGQQHRSPVVALDRLQCHPDLAVGSGRPEAAGLAGTERIYLDDNRPVGVGLLPPEAAVERVAALVHHHRSSGGEHLIFEGGSISILQELAKRDDWSAGIDLHVSLLLEKSYIEYDRNMQTRIGEMLGYTGDAPTLIGELRALWLDSAAMSVLRKLMTYSAIIDFCEREGLDLTEMNSTAEAAFRFTFFRIIYREFMNHAERQRCEIAAVLDTFAERGCGVDNILM
ncbi:isopentenyl transferase family protein [Streptomyces sp. NBC_01017]|uniref:isopentenyl transferase family protein n=1 Tax=Streptomyces sp. NBC_01017 TaxID=2903721 RepID=UPI00386681C7|nr:isopentenyl transferase family protein [Streptomyces sp. NBC_01017]WSV35008.1 isopentenyl transferase family protein [Streptomyces sp. NBC_01017]